jgi:hypothetical protein
MSRDETSAVDRDAVEARGVAGLRQAGGRAVGPASPAKVSERNVR